MGMEMIGKKTPQRKIMGKRKNLSEVSVTSSDSFLERMGGVSKISDQFSLLVSLVALRGAFFLIIKTMLGNLVERSRGDRHSQSRRLDGERCPKAADG
jgi:hypothetical protein